MGKAIQVSEVHYPESDGKPMGETDEHFQLVARTGDSARESRGAALPPHPLN